MKNPHLSDLFFNAQHDRYDLYRSASDEKQLKAATADAEDFLTSLNGYLSYADGLTKKDRTKPETLARDFLDRI